ncbi:MAG: hypothetical protein A3K59_06245 [Euryarchaeota archaeon RBG_19FT_COMBO_69_17]|nr:MAG: hypothetical protein A3K59_06245 [Euryarchaeota archaeon RBG_19FT_COMBO_69_17]
MFATKSVNPSPMDVPMITFGGSPTIVELSPMFADVMRPMRKGVDGSLRTLQASRAREAMKMSTVIESMHAARNADRCRNKRKTRLARNLASRRTWSPIHRKKPDAERAATGMNIPKMTPRASQSTKATASSIVRIPRLRVRTPPRSTAIVRCTRSLTISA